MPSLRPFPAVLPSSLSEETVRRRLSALFIALLLVACTLPVAAQDLLYTQRSAANTISTLQRTDGVQTASVLSSAFASADQVAVDADAGLIYFTSGGDIKRSALNGSGVDVIVPDARASALALDTVNETIYWTRDEDGGFNPDIYQVQRANLDGSNVEVLLDRDAGLERPVDLAVDPANSTLYIADRPSNTESRIQQAALDGSGFGALIDLSTVSVTEPQGLTVANGALYFAARTQGQIYRSGLDGSALASLYTNADGDFIRGLAVSSSHLYFTLPGSFDETVRRTDLSGQNEEPLADTELPLGITVDEASSTLYWGDSDEGLLQSGLDGTGLRTVIPADPSSLPVVAPGDIAFDPQTGATYWTNDGSVVSEPFGPTVPSSIQRLAPDGTVTTVLSGADVTRPLGLVLDVENGKIYWAEQASDSDTNDGSIKRATLDGTNVETVVPSLYQSGFLALDRVNGTLYWSDAEDLGFDVAPRLRRADLDGANAETLGYTDNASGVAVDPVAEKLYWAGGSFNQQILRSDLNGANAEVFVDTDIVNDGTTRIVLNNPRDLVVDPVTQTVYWAEAAELDDNRLQGIAFARIDGSETGVLVDADAEAGRNIDARPQGLALIEPAVASTQTVNGSTGAAPVAFGTTGVSIAFSGVSGSGTVTVARYDNGPSDAEGISEANVSQYRVVITATDVTVGAGTEVRFATGDFPGLADPTTVQVYSRASTADGAFTQITDVRVDGSDLVATVDGFSEFVLASSDPANPLPVELTAFTATADGADAVLTWQTASETNNAGFAVEQRQPDGTFASLGFVEGAGTTAEPQAYRFRAETVGYGEQAFRLRQVDTDGTESLSEVQTVRITPAEAVAVSAYPNPFGNGQPARITVTPREAQQVTVDVFDLLSRRVARLHDGRLNAGEATTLTLSGAQHASGVYFVRVVGEQFQTTTRLTLVR